MRMVLSSAQMNLSKIKDIAGQTIIKFDFPNINLLDSSHHGLCTGTLIFTVNTRPGLPDSSVLTNRAGIYFDYNPVVMTNSVVNKVGCSIAETKVVSAPQVAIFPNPAHSQINIEADSRVYTSVAIKNILGQTVMSHALYGGETSLNIAMLPEGIYFVTFNGTDGELVKKLIKAE